MGADFEVVPVGTREAMREAVRVLRENVESFDESGDYPLSSRDASDMADKLERLLP